MPLKIAIDIRPTQMNYAGRGIGNYTSQLIRAVHDFDERNEYLLLYHPTYKIKPFENLKDNFSFYPLPMPIRKPFKGFYLYYDQTTLPRLLKHQEIDVYHSPDFNLPFFKPCRTVATIYDLALVKYPYITGHSRLDNLVFRWKLANASRADEIITISNFSKNDIHAWLKIDEKKINVIYPACTSKKQKNGAKSHSRVEVELGIKKPYLLFVGGINNPLKNLDGLLTVFSSISRSNRSLSLIVCGKIDGVYFADKYQEYTSIVANMGLSDQVRFVGSVAGDMLEALYESALALVFPSKHEGFGLPVIEAMSLGCPVLASNATAIPEAAGEGAILFDPENIQEIENAIQKIIGDSRLRDELIKKGYQRINALSWREAARKTVEIYKRVGRMK